LKQPGWTTYTYSPQQPLNLPKKQYTPSEMIDLTSQYVRGGNNTIYNWKTKVGTSLTPGTDYSSSNGIYSFINVQSDSVFSEMVNASFPLLTLATTKISVSTLTGIENTESEILIFPNPVRDVLNIRSSEPIERADIYTSSGIKVLEKEVNRTNTLSIPVAHLPRGLFIVKIYVNNKVRVVKLVKE
jgi:hypothetical protein